MPNLVIVALPTKEDYVNKISSQKLAHMTILFLGEVDKVQNFNKILDFVSHASNTSLKRFGLDVDHRGTLGEDRADVLFFSKSKWSGFEGINDFRSYLLNNDNIRTAYDSVEQFPEWLPHMTLGYPETPARKDDRDYPGISYVNFDRIGIWFNDYAGIEIPLKGYDWESMDVAMDNTSRKAVENILTHYGVRGMKWGVRRRRTSAVSVTDKRKRIKTRGGHDRPASSDAVRARTLGQVGKKSGLKALSDKELQDYSRRLQLEQGVRRLEYNEKNAAQKFVAGLLGRRGGRAPDEAGNEARKKVGKAIVAAAAA